MPSFHVYVEGPVEPTAEAMRRLAEAIAEKYGLQTADLIARMTKGRFRVKANVDGETADKYRRDLGAIGARVAIEEARGGTSPSLPPRSTPSAGVSTPPPIAEPTPRASAPRVSAAPPIAEARTRTSGGRQQIIERVRASAAPQNIDRDARVSAAPPIVERVRASAAPPVAEAPRATPPRIELDDEPPRASVPPPVANPAPRAAVSTPPPVAAARTPPTGSPLTSGLAAAYSGPQEHSDLGALAHGGSIAVSALDGSGDEEVMENQFSAPTPERPKPAAKGPRPKDVPVEVDMFAPPDAESAEMKMEIAADEIDHRARRRMSTPPVATPVVAAPPSPVTSPPLRRTSTPSIRPATTPVAVVRRSKLGPLAEPRVRFALGVLVAILLGFVPAHVSAGMREHTIYGSIDGKVETAQAAVDSPEDYAALDAFRAEQLNQKHSERKMIAFTSLLIWAACASAFGYVWFRRIPWDRFE